MRQKLLHCPPLVTPQQLVLDSYWEWFSATKHESICLGLKVTREATCILLMAGQVLKNNSFSSIPRLSTAIERPSEMATNPQTSFERSLDLFRRELSDDQIKQMDGANQETLNDTIQATQNILGRRNDLCKLTRIQRFLHAMEHIEKLVTIFLNASDFVAFVWVMETVDFRHSCINDTLGTDQAGAHARHHLDRRRQAAN